MNVNEMLLSRLAQECGEVAHDVLKALDYGLDDKVTLDPYGPRGTEGPTNRERIINELNDVMGVIEMLVYRGILPSNWQNPERQKAKREKVVDYLHYSARVGTLDQDSLDDYQAELEKPSHGRLY